MDVMEIGVWGSGWDLIGSDGGRVAWFPEKRRSALDEKFSVGLDIT
jgi:hypothetical protein